MSERAAIYARISEDREGRELGTGRQEADCRALAARYGWEIAGVYADDDISASEKSSKPRPAYVRLLNDARAGKFDIVLAYKQSRLTRRPREFEDLIELSRDHHIRFAYLRSPDVDLNTAEGREMARHRAAGDAATSDVTGELVARAAQQRAELGLPHGGPRPFGFERDGVTPRPAEFDLIGPAADDLLAGVSLHTIGRRWHLAGVRRTKSQRPIDGAFVADVLRRKRYAGIRVHNGADYPAPWPAAFSEATHHELTARLRSPDTEKRVPANRFNSAALLGSGRYLCATCTPPTALLSAGRNALGLRYLCPRCGLRRLAEPIDALVIEYVASLLEAGHRPDHSAESSALAQLTAERVTLESQLAEHRERRDSMPARIWRTAEVEFEREIRRMRESAERLLTQTAQRLAADESPDNFRWWATQYDVATRAPINLERAREIADRLVVVRVERGQRGRHGVAPVHIERRQSS